MIHGFFYGFFKMIKWNFIKSRNTVTALVYIMHQVAYCNRSTTLKLLFNLNINS